MCVNSISAMRAEDARSERRIINNRMRRQREMKKNMYIFMMTICLIMICSVSLNAIRSNAKSGYEKNSCKYYRSIIVSDHDTLWSLAQEYVDQEHYASINDYITEVKRINSLESDDVYYGEYLVIPYYEDADMQRRNCGNPD